MGLIEVPFFYFFCYNMGVGDIMRKIALITGVSKGLGSVLAYELACFGYDIVGTYNKGLDEVSRLKEKIDKIGVKFDYYKLDLNSTESTNNFIKTVKENYERVDLLINNAALSLDNDFIYKTKDEFMKVLEVNLVGPFLLVQGLCGIMNDGVIVNISSTDGINTYSTYNMDYSASKAGLINLTKSLSLALDNIRVYAICPNWMNTDAIREMNPDYLKDEMNRIGQRELIDPKLIADKIINLIDSKTKSGSIIVVEDNNE